MLVVTALLGDTQFCQMAVDGAHEGRRADEVALGVAAGQQAGQQLTLEAALDVAAVAFLVGADPGQQLRIVSGKGLDLATEGVVVDVPGSVDVADPASLGQGLARQRQHRCLADTAADQHHRRVAIVQGQLTGGGQQFQGVADAHLLMQEVADQTARLLFHRDAIATAVGAAGQAVVAMHDCLVHRQTQADVLAGLGVGHRLAVDRLQGEGANHLALALDLGDTELAQTTPAAGAIGEGLVALGFGGDQQRGQVVVQGRPGVGDLRRHHLAQHLADGGHQAFADDGVLLGLDAQRDVLADHRLHRVDDLLGLAAQADIGQHPSRQRLRLATVGLVGLVEHRLDLRVALEHQRIETGGDGVEVFGDQRGGGIDDGVLGSGGHGVSCQGYGAARSHCGKKPSPRRRPGSFGPTFSLQLVNRASVDMPRHLRCFHGVGAYRSSPFCTLYGASDMPLRLRCANLPQCG